MKVSTWVRIALWFRRTKRKAQRMNAPSILTSKTTQNQLAASGGVAGMVIAALTFLRVTFPAVVPWPAELDVQVVTLLTAVLALVPIVSRSVSMWRDPEKGDRKEALELIANTLIDLPPEVTADAANATQEIVRFITKRTPRPETDKKVRAAKWAALKVALKTKATAARSARGIIENHD